MLTKKQQELLDKVTEKVMNQFGKSLEDATENMIYKAAALTVRDVIMKKWQYSHKKVKDMKAKKLYYLSSEFLMGRLMGANMLNLSLTKDFAKVFEHIGLDTNTVENQETDAGLGNGGLGRLAACFIDSLTTLDLPAYGSTIKYEYGLFRQKIIDGYQYEQPDSWLDNGYVWEIERPEETVEIKFGGKVYTDWYDGKFSFRYENAHTVLAVPYDVPVCGYDSKIINKLRLWSAKAPTDFNMRFFNEGQYARAVEEKEMAEVISKVLYPEDNHLEGKMLRLRQQYFLVSATIQWILKDFKHFHGTNWDIFPEKIAIHINDTHPALAIPELMRILMDEEGLGWDEAWEITRKTFGYTNHTVMSEALEKWPISIFEELLPRIYMIVCEINRRLLENLNSIYPGDEGKIRYMSVIDNGQVSMANLCLATCHAVNGVSKLHTKILTDDIFADYYRIDRSRFFAITNGITFRRWIMQSNPELTKLICDTIGKKWLKDENELAKLKDFADDKNFTEKFAKIKLENKKKLAAYIKEHNGIDVDVNSIFDVQAKRLHEYKRQLLNVFHIMHLYNCICDNPDMEFRARTFIFAAKASPGYKRAKLIIKLINSVAELVNNDPRVNGKIKVVFIENYSVTLAETITASADVSEQISTAGKEASGTGNMKFMLNGAVTVGTFDGANVEMSEQAGEENMYIFGLRADAVSARLRNCDNSEVQHIYATNMPLKRVLDQLVDGTLEPDKPQLFMEIYNALLFGDYGYADPYMVLRDFDAYVSAQNMISKDFTNKDVWNRKAVMNTASAGFFSSDRTIKEYNEYIWNLPKID